MIYPFKSLSLALLLLLIFSVSAQAIKFEGPFEARLLVDDLYLPTQVAFAPDGRIFIAEKSGVLKVALPGTAPQVVYNFESQVASHGDRGFLGIHIDNNFAANGRIYLLYTRLVNPGWPEGPQAQRLTRITVRPDNSLENPENPETIVLGKDSNQNCPDAPNDQDCIPIDAPYHGVGTVRQNPDGTLLVGSGDGAQTQAHHLRAQNPNMMVGKILHIDQDGLGVPGHGFCPEETNLTLNCTKVYASGLRNPYRFDLSPSGRLIAGDVGQDDVEELNEIIKGGNYGWPCFEGPYQHVGWSGTEECKAFYATNHHRGPFYQYGHGGTGASVTAGPLYEGESYPNTFKGKIFFSDYVRGFIKTVDLNTQENGMAREELFATDTGPITDLERMPNGNMAIIDIGFKADGTLGAGRVYEVVYTPGNRAPQPVITAKPPYGKLPLKISFSGENSTDPDGDRLTYQWNFGDGPVVSGIKTTRTYKLTKKTPSYLVRLKVSDGKRAKETITRVFPGDSPPVIKFLDPPSGVQANKTYSLNAKVTEPQEQKYKLKWEVVIYHKDHVHPYKESSSKSFKLTPDKTHLKDSYYIVNLTATDSRGLKRTKSLKLALK